MPVYEYVCKSCQHDFEELVLGAEVPVCPRCASAELRKKFSVFAAGGGESTSVPDVSGASGQGACGTCGDPRGPGACSLN